MARFIRLVKSDLLEENSRASGCYFRKSTVLLQHTGVDLYSFHFLEEKGVCALVLPLLCLQTVYIALDCQGRLDEGLDTGRSCEVGSELSNSTAKTIAGKCTFQIEVRKCCAIVVLQDGRLSLEISHLKSPYESTLQRNCIVF